MVTSAAAVDLLMEKGNFDPQVALAIVEAFRIMMTEMQLVTVPVLDSRLLEAERKTDARFMAIEARFAAIDVRFAELDRKIDVTAARLEKLIEVTCERIKAELVRWVFIAMAGSVAMQATVTAIVNALQHH